MLQSVATIPLVHKKLVRADLPNYESSWPQIERPFVSIYAATTSFFVRRRYGQELYAQHRVHNFGQATGLILSPPQKATTRNAQPHQSCRLMGGRSPGEATQRCMCNTHAHKCKQAAPVKAPCQSGCRPACFSTMQLSDEQPLTTHTAQNRNRTLVASQKAPMTGTLQRHGACPQSGLQHARDVCRCLQTA